MKLRITYCWPGRAWKPCVRQFETSAKFAAWLEPMLARPAITLIEDMVPEADGMPRWVPRETP